MSGELELHVASSGQVRRRPVAGTDTTIFDMPEGFYVEVAGQRTLVALPFGRFLRNVAERQAADMGEELHHADFVVTTDPAVVEARGALHDCEECRAGVQRALRRLREAPDRELVVGQLYWAAPM